MATLDPRIEEIRKRYDLSRDDFWELPQKKGTWIAKHAALEVAAVKAGIMWNLPSTLEADGANKCAAVCVSGVLGDRIEWSIGEASPNNNKNAYPFAMAEKRGKDRVVLKLLGIHGLAYSEDEADDFKQPTPPPSKPTYDPDPDGQVSNWVDQQKHFLNNCLSVADVQAWEELRHDALEKLRKKSTAHWSDLQKYKETRIGNINLKGTH